MVQMRDVGPPVPLQQKIDHSCSSTIALLTLSVRMLEECWFHSLHSHTLKGNETPTRPTFAFADNPLKARYPVSGSK